MKLLKHEQRKEIMTSQPMQKSVTRVEQMVFEYNLTGVSKSTVVFLNGFRMPLENWDQVYSAFVAENQVLLFNRLGVGNSSKAQVAQDGNQVIANLRGLLNALKLTPPYVLVGHSLGGLFAQLYTQQFPQEVTGLVLVDAPHLEEIMLQKQHKPPFLLEFFNESLKKFEKLKDPFKYSEDESIQHTVMQLQSHPFPAIPVAVISGMQKMPFVPNAAFDLHQRYQIENLKLSLLSTHYQCLTSGHFPQITEPKKVIQAILETIEQSKKPTV